MVNPNKGFKWHQDNQNGPIDAFGEPGENEWNALRWCVRRETQRTPPRSPASRARLARPSPAPSADSLPFWAGG
jgi:hypothetical protein